MLDQALGVHVHVGGRLIEDEDPRVGRERAREGEQLSLAGRELDAAFADLGLVSVIERLDERAGADGRRRGGDVLVGGVRAAEGDVRAPFR